MYQLSVLVMVYPFFVADAETGIYWDVEDFPVPNVSCFCKNIRLALGRAGYHGKVSITAYGDKNQYRYEDAGITFVSRGAFLFLFLSLFIFLVYVCL